MKQGELEAQNGRQVLMVETETSLGDFVTHMCMKRSSKCGSSHEDEFK